MPLVNWYACRQWYAGSNTLTDHNICAGYEDASSYGCEVGIVQKGAHDHDCTNLLRGIEHIPSLKTMSIVSISISINISQSVGGVSLIRVRTICMHQFLGGIVCSNCGSGRK